MKSDDKTPATAAAATPHDTIAAPAKNPAAQALGQRGGMRRAAVTSPERRSEIAREAAIRRWGKRLEN